MKFSTQLEYHKIPELDEGYLGYGKLQKPLMEFKQKVVGKTLVLTLKMEKSQNFLAGIL